MRKPLALSFSFLRPHSERVNFMARSRSRSRIQNAEKQAKKQAARQRAALKALYAYEYQQCYDKTIDNLIARYNRLMVSAASGAQSGIDYETRWAQIGAILDYCRDENLGVWPEDGES